jgi:hypothetical protein
MHRTVVRGSRWGRARDVALVACAGWLVVQNLALLALTPRATLARAVGEAAVWVSEHPGVTLAAALVPLAAGVTLAAGMALGALLARPARRHEGTEERHV